MNRETARAEGGLCIVRVANFVTPVSGGLRTALRHLGAGYLAAGHRPVLVVPGSAGSDEWTEQGRVITLPGPRVPGSGGYRVLRDRRRLASLLDALAPDRLEVSDRTTLRWTGAWAKAHGVRSMMVSHESATGVLGTWGVPSGTAQRLADRLNSRTAQDYDTVLCTTAWAAEEFERIGARNVERAPLGVDLETMRPECHDPALRAQLADPQQVLLAMCSRLSGEKRPERALEALAELRRRHRVPAVLAVAGAGPLRGRLERLAAQLRLPVRFLGHLAGRSEVAALLATADAVIAPGPVETFGLAALETLACGTPVAVSRSSALPQVVGGAGIAAADSGAGFALAVRELLERPEAERRAAARARAEEFGWDAATAAFLAAHRAPPTPATAPVPAPAPAPATTGRPSPTAPPAG
ncbi:GDP-mannose-dependent alpha-(1-6)-phosphatidylinositol dimannoside mannosyltransferase [Kitasatospora phosalacinea]|uniref:GDP-mannose-dependent alpha-(1-6)-phosphatidylinositol dimannoside mannosyltransferase n=1 Tax=Kitasatospora phosalacinea TaxID=2065 RepID=A0A9W6QC44_9ACTN|nr:glycosyltransferase [Kitasatospora phosalacinea]GLW71847.1 GDP-mannose-dependent alpha-(1-6)-phosphatidylinositol dimannoside mannosyltransferase [Kitasatospora phosalacinea]